VIEQIIGKENMDLRDKIKEFPASFIQELKNIIVVMGKNNVDDHIAKLQKRIDNQNKEDGGDKKEMAASSDD